MDELLTPELQAKIDEKVEKSLALFIDKASKGGSLEELFKVLITEKVFAKLGPRMNRYMVRKVAKKVVKKVVDKALERHRDKLLIKLQSLK